MRAMALFTATPARRRQVMIALLALATCGALVRHFAPNPSTLRDIGTLLLVLWLPAVGNLVGYLIRKIPRRAPPAAGFAEDAPFSPQLLVRLQPLTLAAEARAAVDAAPRRCTLVVGRRGFTARAQQPVARMLDGAEQELALELLNPQLARKDLKPGTDFHVLVGTTPVAVGRVLGDAVTRTGSAPNPRPTP